MDAAASGQADVAPRAQKRKREPATPGEQASMAEAIKHHHRASRGISLLERWGQKISDECARKRALEKHVNRTSKARARSYSEALEAEPEGDEGSQMHACKSKRSLEAAIEEEAVESGLEPEQISTESMAFETSAVKIRGLDAQRAKRERDAHWKILRKKWRIATSSEEQRELERAPQWKPSGAVKRARVLIEDSEGEQSGASASEREKAAEPEPIIISDDELIEACMNAPPLFGDEADEARAAFSSRWRVTPPPKARVPPLVGPLGGGFAAVAPSRESGAPALFGDDADEAFAAAPEAPAVAGFVPVLFGDDADEVSVKALEEMSSESANGGVSGGASGGASGDDSAQPLPTQGGGAQEPPRGDEAEAEGDGERREASAGASGGNTRKRKRGPAFVGIDDEEADEVANIVNDIFLLMPGPWKANLMGFGAQPSLSPMKRERSARKRLLKQSKGIVSNMRRALRHLVSYIEENELEEATKNRVSADILIDSLEDYDTCARGKACERAAKRAKTGKQPRRNDRGGATATMPIYMGYASLETRLGLPLEATSVSEVKEVGRAGPGMPAVQPMMNLRAVSSLEHTTTDQSASKFERAYAGGGWTTFAASLRTVDLRRTPKVRFESSLVLGKRTRVLCGETTRSKARKKLEMRPLAWRAPIIPISGDDVDLQPMIDAMPDSANGGIFRDFVTAPGAPHTIDNAIEWLDKLASHDTIVKSLRVLTGDDSIGGHHGRHVNPEIARALGLPRHTREAIGYWREQPVIGDANDAAAIARAVTQARKRRTRAGALASCADRYSSVDAQAVEQDAARAACMLAARELFERGVPSTTREQIEAIAGARDESEE
jgi:hypothetical protein